MCPNLRVWLVLRGTVSGFCWLAFDWSLFLTKTKISFSSVAYKTDLTTPNSLFSLRLWYQLNVHFFLSFLFFLSQVTCVWAACENGPTSWRWMEEFGLDFVGKFWVGWSKDWGELLSTMLLLQLCFPWFWLTVLEHSHDMLNVERTHKFWICLQPMRGTELKLCGSLRVCQARGCLTLFLLSLLK